MGLFRRKRRADASGITFGPIRMEAAAFMEALGDESPWMTGDEFDLRAFLSETYDSGFLTTAEVLRAVGQDADRFWQGANLDEQWSGGSREDREAALKTAMQFQNALDEAEHEGDPQIIALHATMRLKALMLATGCDATYHTDYLQRIVADPQQFGVHEFGS